MAEGANEYSPMVLVESVVGEGGIRGVARVFVVVAGGRSCWDLEKKYSKC